MDWNIETNEVFYSEQWKNQIGYENHELKNEFNTWIEHLHPDDATNCQRMVSDYLNNPSGDFIMEFRFRHKNGTYRWIHNKTASITSKKGKCIRMFGTHTDITESKLAANQIKLAIEKAEESDRLKSAFLANMSHEIRTPLNCILGFSELLADPEIEFIQRSEYLQLINTSGNNLLSIVNDIMDISKIEAGQVVIKNTVFSAKDLVSQLKTELEYKAIEKGIVLKIDSNITKNECLIESDEIKIRQILTNFISNALKFTEVGFVEIGYKVEETTIRFQVKDTGIGIPPEFHEHIFERFRQAEKSDTRKYGGNGLGLAISKSLVELLGGKIGVKSDPDGISGGKGSTFYFTIPKAAYKF